MLPIVVELFNPWLFRSTKQRAGGGSGDELEGWFSGILISVHILYPAADTVSAYCTLRTGEFRAGGRGCVCVATAVGYQTHKQGGARILEGERFSTQASPQNLIGK